MCCIGAVPVPLGPASQVLAELEDAGTDAGYTKKIVRFLNSVYNRFDIVLDRFPRHSHAILAPFSRHSHAILTQTRPYTGPVMCATKCPC